MRGDGGADKDNYGAYGLQVSDGKFLGFQLLPGV